jgi:gephyrin
MVAVDEALELIRKHVPLPQPTTVPVNPSLVGHVLLMDVHSSHPVPAFRASIVDGYAVTAAQCGPGGKGIFPVALISHASPGEAPPLKDGSIARITTGAPLPKGAVAVVMVEDTSLVSKTEDGKEEATVEILTDKIQSGQNIREVGSDIKAGTVILRKGDIISPTGGELGLLAAIGVRNAHVCRKPVIGVLSTGDEIVQHDKQEELRLGEVRDTNRPTILAALRSWGIETVDCGIARDKPAALEVVIRDSLRKVDILVTTGGVSMGELDLLKPTIERTLGGTIHFGRVAMKPGKPTTFATVPFKESVRGDRVPKVIFSLPGNPASAMVTLHLFVLPAFRKMLGMSNMTLPKILVTLAHDINADPVRNEYHRATVTVGKDGVLYASSTGGQRSSMVGSLKSANALLCLPLVEVLEKGAKVQAILIGALQSDL